MTVQMVDLKVNMSAAPKAVLTAAKLADLTALQTVALMAVQSAHWMVDDLADPTAM